MRRVAVALSLLVVLLGACRGNDDKTATDRTLPPPTSAQHVPTTVPAMTSSPISTPAGTAQGELNDVTVGDHDGFTRVVFTFADAVPGYSVKVANPPFVQDGSGKAVTVAGNGHLAVRLVARAHDDAGKPTAPRSVDGPKGGSVSEVQLIGDFEGIVNVVIGTTPKTPAFRTFTLSLPSRLVVDVSD
jgi:hypothetical protein